MQFIIDGQQRLTTLTLLLIYLRTAEDADQSASIDDLIFSQKFGRRSFNLDIPSAWPVWRRSYSGRRAGLPRLPIRSGQHHGALRGHRRALPEELRARALPYFVDWLIEYVHLVEITAYSDDDAYTIFETMNDRGLSLTTRRHAQGLPACHVTDDEDRVGAGRPWKERVTALAEARQGRGRRRHQVVVAQPVRRDDPGPQARSACREDFD